MPAGRRPAIPQSYVVVIAIVVAIDAALLAAAAASSTAANITSPSALMIYQAALALHNVRRSPTPPRRPLPPLPAAAAAPIPTETTPAAAAASRHVRRRDKPRPTLTTRPSSHRKQSPSTRLPTRRPAATRRQPTSPPAEWCRRICRSTRTGPASRSSRRPSRRATPRPCAAPAPAAQTPPPPPPATTTRRQALVSLLQNLDAARAFAFAAVPGLAAQAADFDTAFSGVGPYRVAVDLSVNPYFRFYIPQLRLGLPASVFTAVEWAKDPSKALVADSLVWNGALVLQARAGVGSCLPCGRENRTRPRRSNRCT